MTLFTASDYATLRTLTFRQDYPGYKPTVVESPNGDGVLDTGKSYAHVAYKYLDQYSRDVPGASGRVAVLQHYLNAAHTAAWRMAEIQMGVPSAFLPMGSAGALRVLHYPPGTTSALHRDAGMFTINCYRNVSNPGLPQMEAHMGELGELLGLGPATPHRVDALDVEQESIVYFCMPDHAAILPTGQSVGEWVAERMKRSRYER